MSKQQTLHQWFKVNLEVPMTLRYKERYDLPWFSAQAHTWRAYDILANILEYEEGKKRISDTAIENLFIFILVYAKPHTNWSKRVELVFMEELYRRQYNRDKLSYEVLFGPLPKDTDKKD